MTYKDDEDDIVLIQHQADLDLAILQHQQSNQMSLRVIVTPVSS